LNTGAGKIENISLKYTVILPVLAVLTWLFKSAEPLPELICLKAVFLLSVLSFFSRAKTAFKQGYVNSRGRRSCLCRSSFRAKSDYRTQKAASLISKICGYSNSCFVSAISWLKITAKNRLYQLTFFIHIKPNFLAPPMNANKELIKIYEKYRAFRIARNKPKQTQPNPIIRGKINCTKFKEKTKQSHFELYNRKNGNLIFGTFS
jgi:hypothetical protein